MGQTFVYNTGDSKPAVDELQLQFGVFFDGTLNNMKYTELREKYLTKGNDIQPDDDDETIARKEKIRDEALKKQDKAYNAIGRTKESAANKEYLKYLEASHRDFLDKQGTDNSFSNDYTNVARKYKCCKESYAIYVEGIGTGLGVDDKISDSTDDIVADNTHGFAFGAWKTGVRGKVRKGCMALAEKIGKLLPKGNTDKKLTEITIDVFGFSRGATAARNFVYEVAVKEPETPITKNVVTGYRNSRSFGNDSVTPIYENKTIDSDRQEVDTSVLVVGKMPIRGLLGYYLRKNDILSQEELEGMWLTIRFLGIYDTVSSYEETYDDGLILSKNMAKSATGSNLFKDDVVQLHLDSLKVNKAVHFTAKNEHRKNFALTRLKIGTEKTFPGVHCDIGGAYLNETEVKTEIETNNHLSSDGLEKYRQHLIDEYWYKEDQLEILSDYMTSGMDKGWTPPVTRLLTSYKRLQGTRYLKKEYSYIPLQFMEDFFRIELKDNASEIMPISCAEQYQIDDHNPVLKEAYKILKGYVFEDKPEWEFVPDHILNPVAKTTNKTTEPLLPPIVKQDNTYVKKPEVPILIKKEELPKPKVEIDSEGNKVIVLEEVVIKPATEQSTLRRLRNEYLHWSASRKWAGMEPNNGGSPSSSGKRDHY
ncbi:phospholipase effector Tle1 domain-containing protein [Chryseobacterium wangxinyae]|uniref:phospholipase effector Tle1 domain-containing protein n=1 Tax=Chryseobacterium sp. CY353 TaxID=2997334 RepID=UPI00226FA20B|nr:DUF2235 domain-containing protein [Chryseobacterium sp. CY353]MCY0971104.1 DUF2235 domain-containing protein [Chryseobacterium sp. CY353]